MQKNYLRMLCEIDNGKSYGDFINLFKLNTDADRKEISHAIKHVLKNYELKEQLVSDVEELYPEIYQDTNNTLVLIRKLYSKNQFSGRIDFDYDKIENTFIENVQKINSDIIFDTSEVFEHLALKNNKLNINYNLNKNGVILATKITSIDLIYRIWESIDKEQLLVNDNWKIWFNNVSKSCSNNPSKAFVECKFMNKWYVYLKENHPEEAEKIQKDMQHRIVWLKTLKELRSIENWETWFNNKNTHVVFDIINRMIEKESVLIPTETINTLIELISDKKELLSLTNEQGFTLSQKIFSLLPRKEIYEALIKNDPSFKDNKGILYAFDSCPFSLRRKEILPLDNIDFWLGNEEQQEEIIKKISKLSFTNKSQNSQTLFSVCYTLFCGYDLHTLPEKTKEFLLKVAILASRNDPVKSRTENIIAGIMRNETSYPQYSDKEVPHSPYMNIDSLFKRHSVDNDIKIACEKVELNKRVNIEEASVVNKNRL